MAISLEWDEQARIWTLTTGEAFDLGEIYELVERTDWKGATLFLWDLRGLKRGPDSSSELRQAVDFVDKTRQLWAGSRAAILVRRDLDFGVARMFGAFADQIDVEYQVFRDERSALDWLRSTPAL